MNTAGSERNSKKLIKETNSLLENFMIRWKEGQWKSDKDAKVFGHMAIIPLQVLCECQDILEKAKTTNIKCKDDWLIK